MDAQEFDHLGFRHDATAFRTASRRDTRRACFRVRKVMEGVVHDTVALEGNPFTLPEVKTLLEGVTVGGHRLEDERQVLNQAASWRELLTRVESGRFALDRRTYCDLHALVAREEAVEWGVLRTGSVTIAGTDHRPPPPEALSELYAAGIDTLRRRSNVYERAIGTFLFGALHQFFYDGNKRAARLMMNGVLLSAGEDAITVPARRRLEFNEAMIRFYDTLDGTEMMRFMAECSLAPDAQDADPSQ